MKKIIVVMVVLLSACKGYQVKIQDHTVYPSKPKSITR